MKAQLTRGLAVVGAAAILVVGFDAVTYAATGSSLLLGRANVATKVTAISNTGAGAVLNLHTSTSAYPPLVTNGRGLVGNLYAARAASADKLGTLTASALIAQSAPGSIVYTDTADRPGNIDYAAISVPTGNYLVTLSSNVQLTGAASPASPNELVCYLFDGNTDLAEASWVDIGKGWYASPSFTGVASLSASRSIVLSCVTDDGLGWTVPGDGFGPRLTFTRLGASAAHPLS